MGKLFSLLPKGSDNSETVMEIEKAFSIDHSFSAERNLSESITPLLEKVNRTGRAARWLQAFNEIINCGENIGWQKFLAKRVSSNALVGQFSHYPVPAFFIETTASVVSRQVEGIKFLFLNALLVDPSDHNLTNAANRLRNAISGNQPKNKDLLLKLPELGADGAAYLLELGNSLDELDALVKKESNREIVNYLQRLLKKIGRPKRPAAIDGPVNTLPHEPGRPNSGGVKTGVRPGGWLGTPVDNAPDDIHLVNFYVDPLDIDADDFEPPNGLNIVVVDGDEDAVELIPEPEVEHIAQRSSFWIQKKHKIVPNDWSHLTKFERVHLAKFIHENIASENSETRLSAGLLGAMYVTGLSLENLLESKVGSGQTFSSPGVYRREIIMPDRAFKPNKQQLKHLEPVRSELSLQLPEPIASWMNGYCRSGGKNLAQQLGFDVDACKGMIKILLHKLRSDGRYQRIRMERISAALAIEVSLRYRDSVITYLLASTPKQDAPHLSYYVPHNIEKLADNYKTVTTAMVSW